MCKNRLASVLVINIVPTCMNPYQPILLHTLFDGHTLVQSFIIDADLTSSEVYEIAEEI